MSESDQLVAATEVAFEAAVKVTRETLQLRRWPTLAISPPSTTRFTDTIDELSDALNTLAGKWASTGRTDDAEVLRREAHRLRAESHELRDRFIAVPPGTVKKFGGGI